MTIEWLTLEEIEERERQERKKRMLNEKKGIFKWLNQER